MADALVIRDEERARAAHLLRRSTLVVDPARIDRLAGLDTTAAIDDVVNDAASDVEVPGDIGFDRITSWWVERMTRPGSGLHERLTWYWHTVLPTHLEKVTSQPLVGTQLSAFRRLALTDLGAMVEAYATDGALMQYLDAGGSRVPTPNENLARELMELFTVGNGEYDEDDVRNAALAMAGWVVDLRTGEISFDASAAHQGPTTVLGETRQWDVRSIVRHLVAQPATARRHIALLQASFIGQASGDLDAEATWWAGQGLQIRPMVRRILSSPQFDASRLTRPKTPLEYYTSIRSVTGRTGSELWQLIVLGQAPFRPPNVGGWATGDTWLTPAALLPRTQMLTAVDLAEPERAGSASTDEILDLCGIHELTEATRAALDAVEDDSQVRNTDDLRRARLRIALASPEFQLA